MSRDIFGHQHWGQCATGTEWGDHGDAVNFPT